MAVARIDFGPERPRPRVAAVRAAPPPMPAPRGTFILAHGSTWEVHRLESATTWASPCPGRVVPAPLCGESVAELAEKVARLGPLLREMSAAEREAMSLAEKQADVRAILMCLERASDKELSRRFGYNRRTLRRMRRVLASERGHDGICAPGATRIVMRASGREYHLSTWYQRERAAARRPRQKRSI